MKTEILIVANLGLDQCLAVSLIVGKMNYIEELKPFHNSNDESVEYDEIYQGEYLISKDDDDLSENRLNSVPAVCFCNEIDLVSTVSKLVEDPSVIFLVGYNAQVIKKEILGLFKKSQRVLYTPEFGATATIAKKINKNLNRDKYITLRLAAAHILYKEYQNISLGPKYLITEKIRSQAEKMIEYYVNSWAIAYNLFLDDTTNLNRFHHEFLDELIFEQPNKFIDNLFKLEIEMDKETEKLLNKEVYQGDGIFLIKTGSKPFFKTELLKIMVQKGYPFSAVEYIKDLEKHLITADFGQQINLKKGPFKKCDLVGKN